MNYKKRFDPKSISKKDLLNELKTLTNKLGHSPSRKDMMNGTVITKRLYLYGRRFGGLTQACEIAGIVANKGGKYAKYTTKELLDHILELKKSLNRTPTQNDIDKAGKYASGAYKRHFGTYNNVLKKLCLRHNTKFGLTKNEITKDIIRVSCELGRSPRFEEFSEMSNTVTANTACRKLECKNSWNQVLKKCGLSIVYNKNLTEHELKEELDVASKTIKHFRHDYVPVSKLNNQVYTNGKDETQYKSKFEASIGRILFDLKNNKKITSYEYKPCVDRKWADFCVETNSGKIWIGSEGTEKNINKSDEANILKTGKVSNSISCADNEIIIYDGNKLTTSFIKTLSIDERKIVVPALFEFFSKRDFYVPVIDNSRMMKDWERLQTKEVKIINNKISLAPSTGNVIYKKFFPNILKISNSSSGSVLSVLNDDKLLLKVIRNRLGIGYKEIFNITTNMMKQGAKSTGLAAHGSQFKPMVAKAIYNRYVKDGDNVLDYSCGFGSRLLGLMATGKKVKYFGFEPSTQTYKNLLKMSKFFGFNECIKNLGSEVDIFDDKMDFAFSSPPYFDHERYSDEKTQCYNKYSNYNEWLELYWRKTVANIRKMLKPGAKFGANIGNNSNEKMIKITKDMVDIIKQEGFTELEVISISSPISHLAGKANHKIKVKEDYIYIFLKDNYI